MLVSRNGLFQEPRRWHDRLSQTSYRTSHTMVQQKDSRIARDSDRSFMVSLPGTIPREQGSSSCRLDTARVQVRYHEAGELARLRYRRSIRRKPPRCIRCAIFLLYTRLRPNNGVLVPNTIKWNHKHSGPWSYGTSAVCSDFTSMVLFE